MASVRATVKALADERDRLRLQLERVEAQLHQLRIQNDQLREEVRRGKEK